MNTWGEIVKKMKLNMLTDPKSQKSPKVNCNVSFKNQVAYAIPEYIARLDCEYVLANLTRNPELNNTAKSSCELEPAKETCDLPLRDQCHRHDSQTTPK